MRVLVVNAGSSSLKVDLVVDGTHLRSFNGLPLEPGDVDAVGHRVVHGGPNLVQPVVIDDGVETQLRDLVELAPLHQPNSLAGLDAARRLLPGVPHVACFDTAFHATLPAAAYTYALPAAWRNTWGVRRYGFHGLSHAWASQRAQEMLSNARQVVTCHLGAGASLAAVLDGISVDTTMGFTPLDGLVMATRSGAVDPGLVTWLAEHEGLTPAQVAHALEHDSGLLGLGGTADMRELLNRQDRRAQLAIEVYLHRLVGSIASMTAALGGLDTLVFTGGVGENAAEIRRRCTDKLAYLGVTISQRLNRQGRPDIDLSEQGTAVRTLLVRAREDLQIAAGTEQALTTATTGSTTRAAAAPGTSR